MVLFVHGFSKMISQTEIGRIKPHILTNTTQSFNACKIEAEKSRYMLSHEKNEAENCHPTSSQWHFSIISRSTSNK